MEDNLCKSQELKIKVFVSQKILIRRMGGLFSLWEQLARS